MILQLFVQEERLVEMSLRPFVVAFVADRKRQVVQRVGEISGIALLPHDPESLFVWSARFLPEAHPVADTTLRLERPCT